MKSFLPPEHRERTLSYIIAGIVLIGITTVALNLDSISAGFGKVVNASMPFLIGIILALLEYPIARSAEGVLNRTVFKRKPMPTLCRVLSTAFALCVLLAVVIAFFVIVLPEVVRSIQALGTTATTVIQNNAAFINDFAEQHNIPFLSLDGDTLVITWEELIAEATDYISLILNNLMSIGTAVYKIVYQLLIGIITSVYLLMDRDRLCATFKKLTFALTDEKKALLIIRWVRRAGDIFTGFISGKAMDSLIIGVLCYFSMLIFGFEYPLLISTIIGITNMIPFFGPFIGAVPSTLILLIVHPAQALWFLLFIVILQQIDGNIIGPLILGDYLGLGPLWIMIAIVVGSGLFGFVGMLLSIPVFALIYGMIHEYSGFRLSKKGMPEDNLYYTTYPPKPEHKKLFRLPWKRFTDRKKGGKA